MHSLWNFLLVAAGLHGPDTAVPQTRAGTTPSAVPVAVNATSVDAGSIRVDGEIEPHEWGEVAPLPELMQVTPRYGANPSEPTDIRIAYDSRGLYVAFICYMDPAKIRAPFFVRDQSQPGDMVFIELDPGDDGTNGFYFATSASDAIVDAQLSRDVEEERLWDGVWQSATKTTHDGWTAEFFVPWSTMRFRRGAPPQLAVNVGRTISSGNETSRLAAAPQGVPGRLSYAVPVKNIEDVAQQLNLELRPFASLRGAIRRPEGSLDNTWRALPNAGLDLKYGLSGTLTLDVAINPDFGQAEVDAAFLNLGPFEVFLPEKRQFFLESRDIFSSNFNLFYSRRIGAAPTPGDVPAITRSVGDVDEVGELTSLDPVTRIGGAARVTGEVAPGWILGAITATTIPTSGQLSYSDGEAQTVRATPTTQWSAARLRRQFDSQSYIGMIATHVAPARGDDHSVVGGVDYRVRFRERWTQSGQVIATRRGQKTGMGAKSRLSHTSARTMIHVGMELLTPNADFNRLGYMRFADYTLVEVGGHLFNAQPVGRSLRKLEAQAHATVRVDFSGQVTEKMINTDWTLETLGLWRVRAVVGGHFPQIDPYETRGNIPYEVPIHWWSGLTVNSPTDRRVVFQLGTSYGEQAGRPGPDVTASLSLRPLDRLRFDLGSEFHATFGRPRWIAERGDGVPIFGTAETYNAIGDLRVTVGIRPRLSLSLWNRLFYATATHDRFYELRAPSQLVETSAEPWLGQYDIGSTSLVLNGIIRWEYLPGSFFFATYTHRSLLGEQGTVAFDPAGIFSKLAERQASHEDAVFLKVMHLFSL